jgi:cyclase
MRKHTRLILGCLVLLGSATQVHTQGQAARPNPNAWAWKPEIHSVKAGDVEVVPVRGKVSMIVGGGANITVHAGTDGILMVDAGTAAMSTKILAAVKSISKAPIRYIVDTNERPEHAGGNVAISAAGSTIPFRPEEDVRVSDGRVGKDRANVISFLTVYARMSDPAAKLPEDAWPDNTYSYTQKKLYFNDEPVLIMHMPSATDGDSIVHFRTPDVISVGDLVDYSGYPVIDVKAGGNVQTVIDSLNKVIDMTVPNRKSEAGTLVIPSHGRILDQPDVVYYQQMVYIVRDRVKDLMAKGMTLDQIKAARPTRDWDTRWGRDTGPWTTNMFVEAVYNSLKK